MSLEVTWSDEVRRFHEFGPEEVARAAAESSIPDTSWPDQKSRPRAPFDPAAAIAKWDAFISEHGQVSDEWRARSAATDALDALAKELWAQDGQLDALEANLWFHVFTSPDLFDEQSSADRDAFDDTSWLDLSPTLYDRDSARARLTTFNTARSQSSGYWSVRDFIWLGWFVDVMLEPADTVWIFCDAYTRHEASQFLTKIAPYPIDHPTTLIRIEALERHLRIPEDTRLEHYDQKNISAMLAHIPSKAIAHATVTATVNAAINLRHYEYKIPFWLHIQLVDDHQLSVKTMNKLPFHFFDFSNNTSLASARIIALFLELGYDGLPDLVKIASNRCNKHKLSDLLEHICRIHAPEMVRALAQIDGKIESKGIARDYLSREGANAVSGLLALAGRRGKKRDLALDVLGTYIKNGHRDLVEGLLGDAPKAAAKAVREELLSESSRDADPADTEATLAELPAALRTIAALPAEVPFPNDLDPSRLPPLLLAESGKRVPGAVTERVVATLGIKRGGDDTELAEKGGAKRRADALAASDQLRGLVTPESASALWQHLFDQAKVQRNRWSPGVDIIMAVVELGSEAEYRRLETEMRNRSSGFSDHSARVAMSALVQTGERSAWASLLEASVRIRDRRLRKSAHQHLTSLRESRGWTLGELHDRLVPDCRLDDRGTRVFDYGPRQFELVFQGAFDIALTDSDGKRYARLPPARKSDDRDLVKAAKADFKITKEQIKLVVETQTRRLQEDLLTARRWTARAWREDVLSHPLMRHFARTLVWGRYDDDGALMNTFVPNIDGGCMNADFDEVDLPDDAWISITHPLELSEHDVHEWEAVLADFELQQPFDQLHRATYPRETWGEHLPWIGSRAGHGYMYEGLKKTRRWDGLIKLTKGSKRKYGARELGESGFKARLCFHKGAWTLSKGEQQPPDGLYFFRAGDAPTPGAILTPETDLPERVVSEIVREILDAYASESR